MKAELPPPKPPVQEVVLTMSDREASMLRDLVSWDDTIPIVLTAHGYSRVAVRKFLNQIGLVLDQIGIRKQKIEALDLEN